MRLLPLSAKTAQDLIALARAKLNAPGLVSGGSSGVWRLREHASARIPARISIEFTEDCIG